MNSHRRLWTPSATQIAISGASGLLGSAIVARLTAQGYRILRLVRRPARPGEITWDPERGRLDPAALEGVDAVVHLSGEPVGARWSPGRKVRIRRSRVESTRLLSETIAGLARKPEVLISASAIGIYGNRGDEVLTEASPPTSDPGDFLASVVRQWEDAAESARSAGVRVVHPRFGVVLSRQGGALEKLLPAFRMGVGGRMGDGRQWMSWVSLDDAAGAIEHGLMTAGLQGPVNVTAPEPATNADFTRTLGQVLSRPTRFRIPSGVLRLALGEMACGTILASARVLPAKLLGSGYRFHHSTLDRALRDVVGA